MESSTLYRLFQLTYCLNQILKFFAVGFAARLRIGNLAVSGEGVRIGILGGMSPFFAGIPSALNRRTSSIIKALAIPWGR